MDTNWRKILLSFYLTYADCFLFGLIIDFVNYLLKSDLLLIFLKSNILTILLAVLAINISSLSLILSKIKEISIKLKQLNQQFNFDESISFMKNTVIEQVLLILIVSISLIFLGSRIIFLQKYSFIFNAALYGSFIHSIYISWHLVKAIFKITEIDDKT